ncbi:MAG: hypothetical protein ABIL76_05545, partial [candidate division WOR-3 bacterium]
NIIIEFERIKKKFGNRSFRKTFRIFIGSFCKGEYILIPLKVKYELKSSKILEAFNSILGNSIGFSICEISNIEEIKTLIKKCFNGNMRNIGEADAINQILKYMNMNKESISKMFGFKDVEFVFVSNDKKALEVAGSLKIKIINWKDFKETLNEILYIDYQ